MAVVLNSENDSKFRKHFMQVLILIKIRIPEFSAGRDYGLYLTPITNLN